MALTRTVKQVCDAAKAFEDTDAGILLQLFNEAHLYITTQCKLVPDTTYVVPLVAGQQEYTLPDGVAKIWDASFFSNANSHVPMKATNVDSLFYDYGPNWQLLTPSSVVAVYYERGGMIGFVPAPAVTTVAGFPNVTLYYSPATNMGLDDVLPTNIPSIYPWVYRMAELAAPGNGGEFQERMQKVAFYNGQFEKHMKWLREYVFGRVARDKPRASSQVPRIRRP